MKDDRIIRAMDRIEPDAERQNHILHQIYHRTKLGRSNTRKPNLLNNIVKKLAPVAACLTVAVLAVVTVSQLTYTNNSGTATNEGNGDISAPSSSSKNVQFKGFVLTAYAAKNPGEILTANYVSETAPTELQPNVDILLATYSPAMSCVPGLPFTFNNLDMSLMTKVSVDKGELLKWDIESGIITHCGQSMICDNGETLYWSPLDDFDCAGDEATITVTATNGKSEFGEQTIDITSENFIYSAKANELKIV